MQNLGQSITQREMRTIHSGIGRSIGFWTRDSLAQSHFLRTLGGASRWRVNKIETRNKNDEYSNDTIRSPRCWYFPHFDFIIRCDRKWMSWIFWSAAWCSWSNKNLPARRSSLCIRPKMLVKECRKPCFDFFRIRSWCEDYICAERIVAQLVSSPLRP